MQRASFCIYLHKFVHTIRAYETDNCRKNNTEVQDAITYSLLTIKQSKYCIILEHIPNKK